MKVLITGTNKGIGYQLVNIFSKHHPETVIYATSREAPEKAELRWKNIQQSNRIKCKYLDISEVKGVHTFIQQISSDQVKFDVVVNNAGICEMSEDNKQVPTLDASIKTLNTNLMGTINFTKGILPFLGQNCVILNVSSGLAALNKHPKQMIDTLTNPNITEEQIVSLKDRFIEQNNQGKIISFCPNSYSVSKALLNSWSRFVLQKRYLKGNQKAICVTPGFCLTEMTKGWADQPNAKSHSAYSGALRLYQTLLIKNLDPQTFYHRARQSDFMLCGMGLPFDEQAETTQK